MRITNLVHAQNMGGVDQVFRDYNQAFINNGNEVALVISNAENTGKTLQSELEKIVY